MCPDNWQNMSICEFFNGLNERPKGHNARVSHHARLLTPGVNSLKV